MLLFIEEAIFMFAMFMLTIDAYFIHWSAIKFHLLREVRTGVIRLTALIKKTGSG